MGFKIYLTEKQLDVVLKVLMLVERHGRAAYDDVETITSIELKGDAVFKNGEDIVNPSDPQVIKLLTKLKELKSSKTIEATVNGSSTNTGYNNFKKGSEGAKKLNISLAERRRDNLIKYLQQNMLSINFIKGTATMSDSEDENSRTASVDIKTFGMAAAKINVDRDNTSYVPYVDPFKKGPVIDDEDYYSKIKKAKNVCIEIPEDWISDYKQMVSKWAFTKNGKKNINLKFKITTPSELDLS
jgi:hypothetical protein